MGLFTWLARHSSPARPGSGRVTARLLLDARGHVLDVVLVRSCGDIALDARALHLLRMQDHASPGAGVTVCRRWRDVVYTFDR